MEDGGQCVTISGLITTQQWSAGTWASVMILEVSIQTKRCRHTECLIYFGSNTSDSAYYTSERFGKGTGPIYIDYINCTGSEPRLWGKCLHFTHYYGCSHNDDVGVQCQPGM